MGSLRSETEEIEPWKWNLRKGELAAVDSGCALCPLRRNEAAAGDP